MERLLSKFTKAAHLQANTSTSLVISLAVARNHSWLMRVEIAHNIRLLAGLPGGERAIHQNYEKVVARNIMEKHGHIG